MSESTSSSAAEYVIGTLDMIERREFELRLVLDPDLRAQVADWERDLLPLAETAPPVEMPQSAWTPLKVLTEARPGVDNVAPFKPRSSQRRLAVAIVGAMAASIAGVLVFRSSDGRAPTVAPQQMQAVAPPLSRPAPGQGAVAVAKSAPCAVDPQHGVQTAKSVAEPATPQSGPSPSVSSANGIPANGAVVLGGRAAVEADPPADGKERVAAACPPPAPGR